MELEGRNFIREVTSFIFIEDKPEKADIIFVPGGSWPTRLRGRPRRHVPATGNAVRWQWPSRRRRTVRSGASGTLGRRKPPSDRSFLVWKMH